MDKKQVQLAELREIRNLMERSSKFLSLSGFAGIIVGLLALASVAIAYVLIGFNPTPTGNYTLSIEQIKTQEYAYYVFLFTDFGILLIISLFTGVFFAMRKAKKKGFPIWDAQASRLLINMLIPLFVGGFYCMILFYHGHYALIAPSTLIFYGLALINASKYTLNDIRYLGIMEVIVGLLAAVFVQYGLLFWAIGFGILHIIYGTKIYFKHEK